MQNFLRIVQLLIYVILHLGFLVALLLFLGLVVVPCSHSLSA